MITWGFVASYSDIVTTAMPFTMTVNGVVTTFYSTYIGVTGTTGDIVYLNPLGVACYWPAAQSGQIYPIGASKIIAGATINGVARTTTATNLFWAGSPSTV
jgi:hypothetical protein